MGYVFIAVWFLAIGIFYTLKMYWVVKDWCVRLGRKKLVARASKFAQVQRVQAALRRKEGQTYAQRRAQLAQRCGLALRNDDFEKL